MLRKIKLWLFERYFPATAKLEIESLRNDIAELRAQNDRLNAYIDGLEAGMRSQRRVIINNGVTK